MVPPWAAAGSYGPALAGGAMTGQTGYNLAQTTAMGDWFSQNVMPMQGHANAALLQARGDVYKLVALPEDKVGKL